MHRLKYGIIIMGAFLLSTSVWARQDSTNQPLRLDLDLVDGSHIIGVPSITSLPIKTSYARMDIPLEKIASIEIGEDHETAAIDLQNGDKLKGVLNLKPLELETIFGHVSIGIDNVQALRVRTQKGTSLLRNAPATVDALIARDYYATSRTHDPTKHRVLKMPGHPASEILQGFDEWIFMHPSSQTKAASVSYEFDSPISSFQSTIQTVSRQGAVKYAVYADSKLVYEMVLRTADGPKQVALPLGKCKTLKLEVSGCREYILPWGMWGDPRVDQ
jgi:hypothetical protein